MDKSLKNWRGSYKCSNKWEWTIVSISLSILNLLSKNPLINVASHPSTGCGFGSKMVHGIFVFVKHFFAKIPWAPPISKTFLGLLSKIYSENFWWWLGKKD